jgi:parallel beta-helix repeat protein
VSYTLRGRLESRLAALVPVVAAACVLAAAEHRWWPVEAVALMLAVGLVLDVFAYHRLLPYQPGWLALPLGLAELGAVLALMQAAGIAAPLAQAVALFGAGWVCAQLLGQAGFPLLRLGYAEDGGELGRLGVVAAAAVGATLAAAGATAYALRPPVVHLAAGLHQGPLVITRREVLVGEPGSVVRGGIVVRANDVTIKNVSIVGGVNGIAVYGYRGTRIEGVSISGTKMDGIHVRLGGVTIKNCNIDMLGNPIGQGIDISFNMDMGMTMVDGCTIVGGMEGITTHSSMADIAHNRISHTTLHGISVTEMSMGMVTDNEVRNAREVGIYCNDRSICDLHDNTVLDTSGPGFGLLASFQSEANLEDNRLSANPQPIGTMMDAVVSYR